jgi:diguanylate cyclase (GGDEF)-like protein/PAS domain S-box-containing protein
MSFPVPVLQTISYRSATAMAHNLTLGLLLFASNNPLLAQQQAPIPPNAWSALTIIAFVALVITGILAAYAIHLRRRLAFCVDQLQRNHAALAEREAQFHTLTETTSAGIFMLEGNKLALANPALAALVGHTQDELLKMDGMDLIHPDYRTSIREYFAAEQHGEKTPSRHDCKILTKGGESRWVELTAGKFTIDGVTSTMGTMYDITERKQIEDRIKHMAQHDGLTGLANRTLFGDRFRQALASAKRDRYRLGLIFLDLDHFQTINDDLGHHIGDSILKEVARRLQECVRDSDTVARVGGDEFVVLLRTIEESENALAVAEKIQYALSRPFRIADHRIDISVSIGIAIYPEHGVDETELSRNVGSAMSMAKKLEQDKIWIFYYEDQSS